MPEQSEQQGNSSLDANKYVIAAFLFFLSWGVLFALGSANQALSQAFSGTPILNIFLPIPQFHSPMYLLMPVVGFFFMFFLVDWVNRFFKSRHGFSPLLPLLFFALAFIAFYIALFWYIGNYTLLAGRTLTLDEASRMFVGRFKASAYYLFVLSGLLGWVSRFALEKIKL